ncbi:MAG TPA: hypothetical protein ENG03_06070 [Thioploca sp.]|nr:hypothetical protein [Thioploca sp.]
MGIIRFLLLVLLGWILWRFIKRWYQNSQLAKQDSNPSPPPATQHLGAMVRCDYCGLYLPEQEAQSAGEACYCCKAHKQAAQRL